MSLESGTYISDLVATNPQGTDPKSQGDDHLRLIKEVLKNSLPTLSAPLSATLVPANAVGGSALNVQSGLDTLQNTKVSKTGDVMSGALNWSNTGGNWVAGSSKNFRLMCETQPGEASGALMARVGLYYQPGVEWAGASVDFLRGLTTNDGQIRLRGGAGVSESTLSVGNGGMTLVGQTLNHNSAASNFNGGLFMKYSSGTTTKFSHVIYFDTQDTTAFIRGSITPGVSAEVELNPGAGGGSFQLKSTGVGVAPVSWSPASDVRLKDNITLIPEALTKVLNLKGCTYERNDLGGRKMAGVIAQDVQAVLPEGVSVFREDFLAVDPMAVTALLIEAVKELKAEVDDLRAQLASKL